MEAQLPDLLTSLSHVEQKSKSHGENQDPTESTESCRLLRETVVQIPTGLSHL